MTEQINWGILGCARIARRAVIAAIQRSKQARLGAIASRDREKAERWRAEFDIPRAYDNYDQLLADPAIEAVYIPLPNELHKPWTLAAAAAGKHVLCDKPLGCDAREAEEMVAACHRHAVLLLEGFMWRHHPRTTRVVELVQSGTIGSLRFVRASFSLPIDSDDWRLDAKRGGGALWDVGCYGVNLCRLLCGEPMSINASARWWHTGVDMTLAATLAFPDGIIGQIDCSFEQPFRCHCEIVGTTGVIEMPHAFLPPDPADILLRRGEDVEQLRIAPANQYTEMVDYFSGLILTHGSLAPPGEDGLANMRVLDKIRHSARSVTETS